MTDQEKTLSKLEQHVQQTLEDLADMSSKHAPESNEVRQAKEQRFAAEKALVDFRGPNQDNAETNN